MKIQIPDSLKADMPQTMWGKILAATPIVMTVISTMLAGLASSEMTRAQYERSLAAQQQSKAGDQWGFFQAKKLRGAMQRSTLDVIEGTVPVAALDAEALRRVVSGRPELKAVLDSAAGQAALACLQRGEAPDAGAAKKPAPEVVAVQEAVERNLPATEVTKALQALTLPVLEASLREAIEHAAAHDAELKPVTQAIEKLERGLAQAGVAEETLAVRRAFTAARLNFNVARYDGEARLNQAIGGLYELQVRKSNLSADRHRLRSQRFFYGMLAAQMAVIVSTFAMAAQKRSLLWSLATTAGVAAVSFALYVYLFV